MKDVFLKVVDFLKNKGVDYADVRYERHLNERLSVENGILKSYSYITSTGVGIRVLKGGGWGFASTDRLSENEIMKSAKMALEIAEVSSKRSRGFELSPEEVHKDKFESPIEKDPFDVSKSEKIDLLREVTVNMMEVEGIKRSVGEMEFRRIEKLFVNTEGSEIEQVITVSGGEIAAFAVSDEDFQRRSFSDYSTRGWEFIESMKLKERSRKLAEEAASLLKAPEIEPGEYDIVIDGHQMALQIHESCGHPTELDRVFGYEISFAGGSFLTPEKLGKLKYGSEIVNIVADATVTGGLGSFGYDDEGVKAQRSFLVKDGIFVGYLMDRQTASKLGLRSNGASRAQSWNRIPIIRMTNINLLPGKSTLEDLFSGIDHGFYLSTNKSWSIDDLRVNFQFATEIAYEIKGGKLTDRIFKNPIYYGRTTEFWNSCDGIADESHWHVWGIPNCGKGQPPQVMHVGHGTSPARFRKIKVGVAK